MIETYLFLTNKSQHHRRCHVSELHCTSGTTLAIRLR